MLRKKQGPLAFLVLFLGWSIACTNSPQAQYSRAQKVEQAGKSAVALKMYDKLLPRIPAGDKHLRSEVFYRRGECLFRLDQLSDAFASYQEAAELDGSNVLARLRLGELFLSGGVLDKALEQARSILKQAPDDTEASALLGAAAVAAGDTALAEKAFTQVLQRDPSRLTVALALADIYNRADRTDDARAVLKKAAAAQPSSAMAWLALGRLEEQQGNADAAEKAYREAVLVENAPETNLRLAQFLERAARIPEAEQVLRRVDSMRPGLPTALPDFEVISGHAPNALDHYLAALHSATPDRKQSKASLTAPASGQVRERAALVGRLIEADLQAIDEPRQLQKEEARNTVLERARQHLDEYRKELDPATIAVLNAEISLAQSDLPAASAHATNAVALAEHSAPAHYTLGVVKYRSGDPTGARSEWLAALDADTHFVPARTALTSLALESGDAEDAEGYIVTAVQDEPANLQALNLFARTLEAQKRHLAASLIARRALSVDGTAAEPHLVLGEAALRQHSVAEALIQFEQAVLLEPHSKDAIEGLTKVYQRGAISRLTLQKMEQIAAADPPSPTLMEITGRLYADRGWYRDAERCLQSALRLDPKRSTAVTALAKTLVETGQYAAAADSAARLGGKSGALVEAFQAQQQNNIADATRKYEAAIRQGEQSGTAANNLAWIYAQEGRQLDRALKLAETARSQKSGERGGAGHARSSALAAAGVLTGGQRPGKREPFGCAAGCRS